MRAPPPKPSDAPPATLYVPLSLPPLSIRHVPEPISTAPLLLNVTEPDITCDPALDNSSVPMLSTRAVPLQKLNGVAFVVLTRSVAPAAFTSVFVPPFV